MVEQDQADLGLVSYPKPTRTITAVPWRKEPMVLVCAPSNPLAGHKTITWSQLNGVNLISFDRDLGIRREIDKVLSQYRVEANIVMQFDNIETIKGAIEIDAGVALLPEPTVAREVEAGVLTAVPLATDELVRPVGMIFRRGKQLGNTARRFVDLLRGGDQAPAEAVSASASSDS
jgi:DNA-binding transcriptional LysR family regulator